MATQNTVVDATGASVTLTIIVTTWIYVLVGRITGKSLNLCLAVTLINTSRILVCTYIVLPQTTQ